MNNELKNLKNNTFIFIIGNLGSKLIQFILMPLYTYILTTEQYGTIDIVMNWINILTPIFSISIVDALLRFGLDKNFIKEDIFRNTLVITLTGTLVSIWIFFLYSFSTEMKNWSIYLLIILNLRIYRDLFSTYLKVKNKNRIYTLDSIIYTFNLCSFAILFLVIFKLGIKGYFISYIIANIISIIFLIITGNILMILKNININFEIIRILIRYSFPMIFNSISWWIIGTSDRFMINYYLGISSVGIYSVATKIPSFVTTFTGIFNQAWIISSINIYTDSNNQIDKKVIDKIFEKYYFLLIIFSSLILLILRGFMKLYVGEEFFISWKYAVILICSTVFSGIAAFSVGIFSAIKGSSQITYTTITGAGINIILNFILIKKIGLMGASIATYICWFIISFLRYYILTKKIDYRINWFNILQDNFLLLIQAIIIISELKYGIYFSIFILLMILVRNRSILIDILEK